MDGHLAGKFSERFEETVREVRKVQGATPCGRSYNVMCRWEVFSKVVPLEVGSLGRQILPGDGELLRLGLQEITRRPAAFSVEQLVAVVWSAAILQWPLPPGAAATLVRHVLDSPSPADTQVR